MMPVSGRKRTTIHVVLPAFNEALNIARLLDRIAATMEEGGLAYRIILVDDGSTDETVAAAGAFRNAIPLEIISHEHNQGLGATLRDGLIHALKDADDNDIVITMDADETHAPGLILHMSRKIREGHDVVIASRFRPGARVYGVPVSRRFLSWAGCWVMRLSFPFSNIRDFTCGYRAYRGGALKIAVAHYGSRLVDADGFQCMVDILLKLHKLNMIIGEVPVILRYDLKQGRSKMRVASTIRGTLSVLFRRRLGLP